MFKCQCIFCWTSHCQVGSLWTSPVWSIVMDCGWPFVSQCSKNYEYDDPSPTSTSGETETPKITLFQKHFPLFQWSNKHKVQFHIWIYLELFAYIVHCHPSISIIAVIHPKRSHVSAGSITALNDQAVDVHRLDEIHLNPWVSARLSTPGTWNIWRLLIFLNFLISSLYAEFENITKYHHFLSTILKARAKSTIGICNPPSPVQQQCFWESIEQYKMQDTRVNSKQRHNYEGFQKLT